MENQNQIPEFTDPKHQQYYTKFRGKLEVWINGNLPENLKPYTEYLLLLPDFFVLSVRLFQDPRVSTTHKLILGGLVAYLLSPIDIIPDFIPGLGIMDDVAIVVLVFSKILREVPEEIYLEHWSGSDNLALSIKELTLAVEDILPKDIMGKIKGFVDQLFKRAT